MVKKIGILLLLLVPVFVFSADVSSDFKKNFNTNLQNRNIKNVDVDLQVIRKVDFMPNFYFSKLIIHDKNRKTDMSQYVLTDGRNLITEVVDIKTGNSVVKDMSFLENQSNIDTSMLSLVYGDRKSKNIIVEITDFECPYCKNAFNYIHTKIKDRKDVAVYIMNFPLDMHKNALIMAKIFEAGLKNGSNFAEDLFNGNYKNMDNNTLIDTFARKTKYPVKFKELASSSEISNRIRGHMNYAKTLGVNSTPIIYINGRQIRGFNKNMIDKAFDLFK
jgi:protein-disulfide isomerase